MTEKQANKASATMPSEKAQKADRGWRHLHIYPKFQAAVELQATKKGTVEDAVTSEIMVCC